MLWVLIGIASLRQFQWVPKHMFPWKKKRTIFSERDVSRVESCSMFSNDTPDILLHLWQWKLMDFTTISIYTRSQFSTCYKLVERKWDVIKKIWSEWKRTLNSLSAFGDFCHLLITFANSLDPDQAGWLTLWWYSWKIFLKKWILKKKICRQQKSIQNNSACKELTTCN